MSNWRKIAWMVIDDVHHRLPDGVSFVDRKQAIDAAFPFGVRSHYPYKVWLSCRRAYLKRYEPKPEGAML